MSYSRDISIDTSSKFKIKDSCQTIILEETVEYIEKNGLMTIEPIITVGNIDENSPMRIEPIITKRLESVRRGHRGVVKSNIRKITRNNDFYGFPSILFTNLRSIANKFDQVEMTLMKFFPSIAIFVETWITEERIGAYNIDNYVAYNRIRNRIDKHHGGGILAYVNKDITVQDFRCAVNPNIEAFTIVLRPSLLPKNISWFAFIVFYFPPGDDHGDILKSYIMDELDRLFSVNSRAVVFVLGDFNDFESSFLYNYTSFKQLIIAPTRGDAILDKCFTNATFGYHLEICPPISSSDHCLILLNPYQSSPLKNHSETITFRPKKKSYFQKMGEKIVSFDWSFVFDSIDVNEAADYFHEVILNFYYQCFPEKTRKVRSNNPLWFNEAIGLLIEERNNAFKSKNVDLFSELNIKVKNAIRLAKSQWLDGLIKNCPIGSGKFYSQINRVVGNKGFKGEIIFPNKNYNESFMEIFNFFSGLANSHPPMETNNIVKKDLPMDIPLIERFEVYRSLSSIENKCSSSPDAIPNYVWKELSMELVDPITSLINLSLMSGVCPNIWKKSTLVTIPKVNNPTNPQQLRPISITTPLVKICEKHILNNILPVLLPKLDAFQFGGVPNKSTSQYLALYMHNALSILESRSKSVCSIITDFIKAYDNVDHGIFMSKFQDILPFPLINKWIESFLFNRYQIMINKKDGSDLYFKCTNGVPQGSVLGSLIFAILINEIALDSEFHLKYVDDLTISSMVDLSNMNGPQHIANRFINQTESINMPINPVKCNLIIHSFLREKPHPVVVMSGHVLEELECVKILGIFIQSDLRWGSQVNHLIKKANGLFFILYKLKRLGASKEVLKMSYVSFIRSGLEYGAPVWGPGLTKAQNRSIEYIQKRALKIILGNSYINYDHALKVTNLMSLADRRCKLSIDFIRNFFVQFPQFIPPVQGTLSGRCTRNADKLVIPHSRTERFFTSPIVYGIKLLNVNS